MGRWICCQTRARSTRTSLSGSLRGDFLPKDPEKAPLLLFLSISHIGIRRRVFALLVFCLSCSLWISVSLFIYFVFVGLLTLQPGFLAEPFVVLLLTWRIDFQIRSWGLCCHSAESLEKVENLWCFPAC